MAPHDAPYHDPADPDGDAWLDRVRRPDFDDELDAEPDLDDAFDEDDAESDGLADVDATVWCPYCGEPNTVALDPGSGVRQCYVEDCQVCCQPWQVEVRYASDGAATVTVRAGDES
jgi:hypothetical protein